MSLLIFNLIWFGLLVGLFVVLNTPNTDSRIINKREAATQLVIGGVFFIGGSILSLAITIAIWHWP